MIGKLIDLTFTRDKKQRVLVEIDEDFRNGFDALKDCVVDVEIRKHREKRSLSANAYFHVLVNKIAAVKGGSDSEVKRDLVVEYGAIASDEDGKKIGFKLPATVDVDLIYPYTRCFDEREENGVLFKCYIVYKHTHTMNSAEMSRLIDGAIEVAKELGIETDTPEVLAKNKQLWEKELN